MKLEEINVKSIIALIVVSFGICAIVFVDIKDMALGALISFVSQVIGYFFGSSKSSADKDKTISKMSETQTNEELIGGRPDER